MSWRILYVDDEADIREVASLSLELDPDFEILTCASGHEALIRAREWMPDLILLDVMMPGMDGPTTLAGCASSPKPHRSRSSSSPPAPSRQRLKTFSASAPAE